MNAPPNNVREFFFAALKLTPDRWADYLDEACGHDTVLRQRVQDLLAAHREVGGFLEPAPGGLPATADDAATDRPGADH
jgi:hypothetical protein